MSVSLLLLLSLREPAPQISTVNAVRPCQRDVTCLLLLQRELRAQQCIRVGMLSAGRLTLLWALQGLPGTSGTCTPCADGPPCIDCQNDPSKFQCKLFDIVSKSC